jgi:hypothetical protein
MLPLLFIDDFWLFGVSLLELFLSSTPGELPECCDVVSELCWKKGEKNKYLLDRLAKIQ